MLMGPPVENSILREVPKYIVAGISTLRKSLFSKDTCKKLQESEGRGKHYFQVTACHSFESYPVYTLFLK